MQLSLGVRKVSGFVRNKISDLQFILSFCEAFAKPGAREPREREEEKERTKYRHDSLFSLTLNDSPGRPIRQLHLSFKPCVYRVKKGNKLLAYIEERRDGIKLPFHTHHLSLVIHREEEEEEEEEEERENYASIGSPRGVLFLAFTDKT